jgi:transposase
MEDDRRIELYESGLSIKQVASMTNYSTSAVWSWLHKNEVEMRPQGRPSTRMDGIESNQ